MKNPHSLSRNVIEITPQAIADGNGVTTCVNLWPRRSVNGLVASTAPRPIASGAYEPLLEWHGRVESSLIACHGTQLAVITSDGAQPIATLSGKPLCAAQTAPDQAILMTADGPAYLDYDGSSWTVRQGKPKFTPLRIAVRTHGHMSARVDAFTPRSGDLRRTNPMTGTDLDSLSTSMLDAYTRMGMLAAEAGCWIQPLLIRYRYLDKYGSTLHESMPQAVGPDTGFGCIDAIDVEIDKSSHSQWSIAAFDVEASAFDLSVTLPAIDNANPWMSRVAAVEIYATPQLHPVDFQSSAPCRVLQPSSNSPTMRLALPGATRHFADGASSRSDTVRGLLARFDAASDCVLRLTAPFDTQPIVLSNNRPQPPRDELTRIKAVLARGVKRADTALLRIMPPHRFTADVCVQSGDSTVWGNVGSLPCDTADICELTTRPGETSDGWQGRVEVYGTAGLMATNNSSGTGAIPTAFGPVLAYPDSSATEMRLYVRSVDDGTTLTRRFALAPSADGRYACWIAPNLAPVILTDSVATLPSYEAPTRGLTLYGSVMASEPAMPLMASSCLKVCASPIVALMPAVRSQSSWDFSRGHFYAFSRSGVYAVSASASRRLTSASLLDVRGVDAGIRPAFTPVGVIAATNNQLLCVAGARATTLMRLPGITHLGYDAAQDRLWISGSYMPLASVDIDSRQLTLHHGFSDGDVAVASLSDTAYIISDGENGSLLKADPTPGEASARHIEWRWHTRLPDRSKIRGIEIHLTASAFDGSVTLWAGDRNQHAAPMAEVCRLGLSGTIVSPVVARIAMPKRACVAVSIEGDASADFTLNLIRLLL